MCSTGDAQPVIRVNGHAPPPITCGEIRARLPPEDLPLGEPVDPALIAELVATEIPVPLERLPEDAFEHPQDVSTLQEFLAVRAILREGFGVMPPARLVVMMRECYATFWVVAVDFGDGPKFFRLDCCDDGFDMRYTLPHQWRSTWEECFVDGLGRRFEEEEEDQNQNQDQDQDQNEGEDEDAEKEDEEDLELPESGPQHFTLNEAALDALFNRRRDEAMLRRLLSGLPDESIAPLAAREIWTRLEYGLSSYAMSDEESTEGSEN